MMAALASAEYESPTPVQMGVIPQTLAGRDVLAQAQTGTGKTAAFAIPILEQMDPDADLPQALVLVPTRELAEQVMGEFAKLSGHRDACVVLSGGRPIRQQIDRLRRRPHVVVGTPGRVLDHLSRRTLLLEELNFAVLDEADRMLDIGFRPDIERILKQCPRDRQTLLLSATVPPSVQRIARRYMRSPVAINFVPRNQVAVETIEQRYLTVDPHRKFDLLVELLRRENPQQAIVFCRTRRGTERIANRVRKLFEQVGCIHGDMPQPARDRTMRQFRAGELQILVATDVVGRGIDVTGISHIINYDIPQDSDDYVHRVGRTGRMGRSGIAFTLVSPDEGVELTRIEMRIDRLLEQDHIEGFDDGTDAEPISDSGETTDADSEKTTVPEGKQPPGRRTRRYRRGL